MFSAQLLITLRTVQSALLGDAATSAKAGRIRLCCTRIALLYALGKLTPHLGRVELASETDLDFLKVEIVHHGLERETHATVA